MQTSSSGSPSTVRFSPKWPGARSSRPNSGAPVPVGVELVHQHRAVLTAVPAEVALAVAVDVELSRPSGPVTASLKTPVKTVFRASRSLSAKRGSRHLGSACTSQGRHANSRDEGTPARARQCPRVPGVCKPRQGRMPLAGISRKPADGLEPSTPSLPSSDEAGTAGTSGKPRARKPRKKKESAKDE